MPEVQLAVTALIAAVASLIAWRQYQTARAKLRLDLNDRRYRVYLRLVAFMNDLQGRVVPDAEYAAHVRRLDQVQFLFDTPLKAWVRSLLRDARSMNNARRVTQRAEHNNPEGIPHETIMEASRTYSRLTLEFDEHLERVDDLFLPYLDFRTNL